jgi:flagellar motor switch protein FliG
VPKELTNTEKAALTLLTLGKEAASKILQHLNEHEVKRISRAFLSVSELDRETQFLIAKEFRELLKAGKTVLVDGKEFAKEVISGAFGEQAESLLDYITGAKKESIGQILSDIPPNILISFIQSEYPQTAAFLLSKMNIDQAAMVLQSLGEEEQVDIIIRMATVTNVKSEVVDEVREVLKNQLKGSLLSQDEQVGGPKTAANILNYVDRSVEQRILSEIEESYPELAEEIRNLMFTFDDLKKLDDRSIQTVLKEVPRDVLVLALKTASEEIKNLIYKNISQRAAEMIKEDLANLGPVKVKEVEKAQQQIIDVVRRLEAEGKIAIGGGAEEQYV